MVSIVAADVLVLQHQAMSMQNTDLHYKRWLVHSKVNALDCDAASSMLYSILWILLERINCE